MVNLEQFKVATLNVNGLRSDTKRRTLFNLFKNDQAHIVLLQETHSTEKEERIWSNEWGNKIIFSHGTNMARGVAVLFAKHLPVRVESVKQDLEGRFLILDLALGEFQFILVNAYGPNDDNTQF